ncbi:hypothetical protein, partial [Serratia marcescens]|uniref:hypothetical protein n=1 Tax=Serratia marcescens TaxID=615 RepID=UPI001C2D469B
ADRNRSHWSTSKTPSYTKSVSWQHHPHAATINHRAGKSPQQRLNNGTYYFPDAAHAASGLIISLAAIFAIFNI